MKLLMELAALGVLDFHQPSGQTLQPVGVLSQRLLRALALGDVMRDRLRRRPPLLRHRYHLGFQVDRGAVCADHLDFDRAGRAALPSAEERA